MGTSFRMGEELDHFLEYQRAKLAQDKAEVEMDPPYMEIRSKIIENANVVDKPRTYAKEDIPFNRQSQKEAVQRQIGDTGYGLSLPLGEDYERKKHKLKEELRQDYRKYLNQGNAQAKRKKHLRTTAQVDPLTQGMSLPIGERLSAKERLRLERNQEYNQFLRMKDGEHERLHKAALEEEKYVPNNETQDRLNPEQYPSVPVSSRDQAVPKKDAYTSMEVYEQLLNKRRSEAKRPGRQDNQTEAQDPFRRRNVDNDTVNHPRYVSRDWELERREQERRPFRINLNDVDDSDTRRLKYDREVQERQSMAYNPRPERVLRQHGDARENHGYGPDQASYFQIDRSDHRPYKERRDRQYPMDYEDDFREQTNRRPDTSVMRSRAKVENPAQQTDRSKSANNKDENFSTSLHLGGADKDDIQKRRKERYREELMQQMAEQQRNKRREKELELTVAASGAIDPEKQPDRLRQFGAITRQQEMSERNVPYRPGILVDPQKTSRTVIEKKPVIEERSPPERPRVAFQTPMPEPPVTGNAFPTTFNLANDEYQRGISNALGEIVAPRISAAPPPQPPVLVDNYRTPYDDAYYYYGARNPLDPNLAYYPPSMMAVQATPGINMPVAHVNQTYPENHIVDNKQRSGTGKGASLGVFPEERPRQTRDAAISYQEELQQQIRERNDRRRKEKEETERYEAKLEAEIKNYNPWGKGGGGAPLKDQKGNLITDLKQMHKYNEDAYQNPETRAFEDKRTVVAVDTSLADNTLSAGKIPGFSFANNSQFARGNVFSEPVTEQQVQQQESYKNFLRRQIEEKRRKEEEERERIRLEEEREERRLAEQRAKIQREFEEEQNRKKMKEEEQRQKNEELVRLADERRKEAERKRKEEEAKHDEELKRLYEQERTTSVLEEQDRPPRQLSPVIPALQHKLSSRTQRPPTADSRASIQSHDEPQSRAVSPPVPARQNQLRAYVAADEKKSVISELTELRKQLRSEQRRLEGRLQDTERDNDSIPSMSGRRREKSSADVFELARQRLQATVRRPSLKDLDNVNVQNIREFNDLKYRDTDTRDGVRTMFPDPPKDDQTLEIQQQALLREQQKNLNKIKRRPAIPDEFGPVYEYSLNRPGMLSDPSKDLLKTSLLESESAFIGENGEPYPAFFDQFPDLHALPSARERRRNKNKVLNYENDIPPVPPIPLHQPDRYSLNSSASFNVDEVQTRNEERLRRLSNLQKSTVSIDDDPDSFGNADDFLKSFPTKPGVRPQSVDTVATDPWMRPGTSETLKRFMAGQMSHDKPTNENALTFNWQGLSTAHG
ncbi:centrosome and spindle pole-associated protein 1 isoform X2 [Hyla sarda]|uniref:centrosome and spindle pole-associated protein 1 isoform X2 n=1 Tax=Hyla sarda TaxID=327740 RepID=UPI0024C46ACA|nr:centrosome and spindle pole-associated protein 1 isoform X2 [Hyla sarda]